MRILNLAKTGLLSVEGLEDCHNLCFLNLGFNKITNTKALSKLLHLSELFIKNNEISNTTEICRIKSLKLLDLSYNKISKFEDAASLGWMQNLKKLKLKGNAICKKEGYSAIEHTLFMNKFKLSDKENLETHSKYKSISSIAFSKKSEAPQSKRSSSISEESEDKASDQPVKALSTTEQASKWCKWSKETLKPSKSRKKQPMSLRKRISQDICSTITTSHSKKRSKSRTPTNYTTQPHALYSSTIYNTQNINNTQNTLIPSSSFLSQQNHKEKDEEKEISQNEDLLSAPLKEKRMPSRSQSPNQKGNNPSSSFEISNNLKFNYSFALNSGRIKISKHRHSNPALHLQAKGIQYDNFFSHGLPSLRHDQENDPENQEPGLNFGCFNKTHACTPTARAIQDSHKFKSKTQQESHGKSGILDNLKNVVAELKAKNKYLMEENLDKHPVGEINMTTTMNTMQTLNSMNNPLNTNNTMVTPKNFYSNGVIDEKMNDSSYKFNQMTVFNTTSKCLEINKADYLRKCNEEYESVADIPVKEFCVVDKASIKESIVGDKFGNPIQAMMIGNPNPNLNRKKKALSLKSSKNSTNNSLKYSVNPNKAYQTARPLQNTRTKPSKFQKTN